ncbi:MAG TPA: hypothetical protein VGM97_00770 [Steroidobacteraceae bacterium]
MAAVLANPPAGGKRRSDHVFFSTVAVPSACTIVGGFSRSYYLKAFTFAAPLPWFVHLHAAMVLLEYKPVEHCERGVVECGAQWRRRGTHS